MKTGLDSILRDLRGRGTEFQLAEQTCKDIATLGLRAKNLLLALQVVDILQREQPISLRGLFYRAVSAGLLPATSQKYYNQLGRLMTKLRQADVVPHEWIVDNGRTTLHIRGWRDLPTFLGAVGKSYQKDFWRELPDFVHLICEKDAIASVLAPVATEWRVPLSPIRGYCSISQVRKVAKHWNEMDKPIHVYYLGDYDPSGFDLERDYHQKADDCCPLLASWTRLGVLAEDFDAFRLLPLAPKKSDSRYKGFCEEHGQRCAEIDALPATELRRRLEEAITAHVPMETWEALEAEEAAEKARLQSAIKEWGRAA